VGDWHLIKETTWLLLLFLPIPVKVRYYSMCPGCRGTAEMTKEEFNAAVQAAERREG